jgi:quercetin dioxygenase-like cupin family protein
MVFPDLNNRAIKDLLPGIHARTFWGDQMLMAVVDLDPLAIVPPHRHPHEQCGVILQGDLEFNIAGEVRMLHAGDLYLIPGGIEHSVIAGAESARVLDIFSPVREEYKY